MYAYKRILVGLDLTEFDDTLIRYASFFCDFTNANHVYFVHIASNLDLPKEILEEHPDLVSPIDEEIEKSLQDKVDRLFTNKAGCKVSVELHEGNATDKILRWSNIKEIDLIVMGRKQELRGHGILPAKIANMCHCSMLLVPGNAKNEINRISVPLDFSEFSKLAMEKAIKIKSINGARVIAQNIYHVPSGYHASGKSFEEFSEIMKMNAEKEFNKFLSALKINPAEVELQLALDKDQDASAKELYAMAKDKKSDLMIIGSKGRTALASLVLGSFVEKMIKVNDSIPTLVVKDKVENLTFFEALMKL